MTHFQVASTSAQVMSCPSDHFMPGLSFQVTSILVPLTTTSPFVVVGASAACPEPDRPETEAGETTFVHADPPRSGCRDSSQQNRDCQAAAALLVPGGATFSTADTELATQRRTHGEPRSQRWSVTMEMRPMR